MSQHKSGRSVVFKINMNLLGAFSYGVAAWLIWPDSLKGWGFGLISIILGVAAPAQLVRAIIMMAEFHTREKEFAEFEENNRAAEPSELASVDDLRRAGMIE